MNIVGYILDYQNAREFMLKTAKKIGDIIYEAVKDIIPDLEFEVGDSEDPTLICFYLKIGREAKEGISDWKRFCDLVMEIFPELEDYITDDLIFFSSEMQKKIIERLETLRDKK